jgi:hypothetical protein
MISDLDGVHYVGGTGNCYLRWNKHRSEINRKVPCRYSKEFLSALKANKLLFFLLEHCVPTKEREQFWMDQFPNRVNKSRFPTNKGVTFKHTPEFCKSVSLRVKGNQYGKANKGRPLSTETCKKLSQALMGNKNGIGNKASLGLKASTDTRAKMSKSAKAVWKKRKRKGV